MNRRPDIDRWILSDLQLLIKTARQSFEAFNVHGVLPGSGEVRRRPLSNWYVRRNRRRSGRASKGSDKLAAYQTLYTVLTTLTKLFAPVVPFLAESMYQNLGRVGDRGSEDSVHLCDYPQSMSR